MNAPLITAPAKIGNITYHPNVIQGSEEWLAMRCGLLTASEMKYILTPTLKVASNDKERSHVCEIAGQRVTGYVEPHYISDDMLRGRDDEIEARILYDKHIARVQECGFITNDCFGFTLGYSPDALVGAEGLIECKSRRAKFQIQTIADGEVPTEYILQLQTGLLVTGRKWIDFISYSGGLPMYVQRVEPDLELQAAIIDAASAFEARVADRIKKFTANSDGLIPTERRVEQEMFV